MATAAASSAAQKEKLQQFSIPSAVFKKSLLKLNEISNESLSNVLNSKRKETKDTSGDENDYGDGTTIEFTEGAAEGLRLCHAKFLSAMASSITATQKKEAVKTVKADIMFETFFVSSDRKVNKTEFLQNLKKSKIDKEIIAFHEAKQNSFNSATESRKKKKKKKKLSETDIQKQEELLLSAAKKYKSDIKFSVDKK